MKRFILTMIAAGVLAHAQDADKIRDRKADQQKRIGQGVANGSLTPKETRNLENKEVKLNKEIRSDRQANGGNLTNNEKKQVNRQQNNLSKKIYNKKHNAATQ